MANTFIPFGLKVRDITSAGITIEWDLDNTVEFRPGTYYKVYTSMDNVSYTVLEQANIKYHSFALKSVPYWMKVTSFVVGLGESLPSAPFQITQVIGVTDSQDQTTVAITPSGEPIKLKTTPTGELAVALSGAQLTIDNAVLNIGVGLAKEIKQDALLLSLNNLKDNNHTDLDAVLQRLVVMQAALEIAPFPHLMRAETNVTNVTPAGLVIVLPFKKKALIHQITVVKEFGSASSWTLEIHNKAALVTEKNVIVREFSYNQYDPNRFDVLKTIPYFNSEGLDQIVVKIIPNTGTSNNFNIAISGEEAI
jgi:hypothetical protein